MNSPVFTNEAPKHEPVKYSNHPERRAVEEQAYLDGVLAGFANGQQAGNVASPQGTLEGYNANNYPAAHEERARVAFRAGEVLGHIQGEQVAREARLGHPDSSGMAAIPLPPSQR